MMRSCRTGLLPITIALLLGNTTFAQTLDFNDGGEYLIPANEKVVDRFVTIGNRSTVEVIGNVENRIPLVLATTGRRHVVNVSDATLILGGQQIDRASVTGGLPIILNAGASMDARSGEIFARGGADIKTVAVEVAEGAWLGLHGTHVRATSGDDVAIAIGSRGDTLMTSGLLFSAGGSDEATAVEIDGGQFRIDGGEVRGRLRPGVIVNAGSLLMNGGVIRNVVPDFPDIPHRAGLDVRGRAVLADGLVQGDGTVLANSISVSGQAAITGATIDGDVRLMGESSTFVSHLKTLDAEPAHIRLTDTAQLTISANDLNYPVDEALTDPAGVITGRWANGDAFSLSFERLPETTINFTAPVLGDFDGDSQVTAADIDIVTASLHHGHNALQFDVTSDSRLDDADRAKVIGELAGAVIGDSNMDGQFDSADFVTALQFAEYGDRLTMNSTWVTGDWNGDLEFDSSDLVYAFQAGAYRSGVASQRAVPEPSSRLMLALAAFGLHAVRWRC